MDIASLRHARHAKAAAGERGFTLIELLVVILLIGILAAIAIPTFLSQSQKANDAQAKALVRNAATTMEAYATDNDGSYTGANVPVLNSLDPSLNTNTSSKDAYLSVATGSASGFTVMAYSPGDSEAFSIVKSGASVTRSCAPASVGSCMAGGSW